MNATRLLKDRHDYLSRVKAHGSASDESRQNLSTLIEHSYYASNNADDIPSVESMITEIDSAVTQMSQRLKSLADYDNDLDRQDNSLINEQAPQIIRSLRMRITCLQLREDVATLKNRKKAARPQLERSPLEFIPDPSEASAVPNVNKSVAGESMLTQGADQQVLCPLNPLP